MRNHVIVIVTYNRLELLKECLEAVLSQNLPYSHIVVVDNASTDGTADYLRQFERNGIFTVIRPRRNRGGAGGFALGIDRAMRLEPDYVTLIDDDAVLGADYSERIEQGIREWEGRAQMFAGVPLTGGIRPGHRRRIRGRLIKKEAAVPLCEYEKEYFLCSIASFCGLVISGDLIRRIGLPEKRYFIWYDDTEYCLRALPYSPIVNCCRAVIDHKALSGDGSYRIGWKEYYGIRNRIDMAIRHYGRPTASYIGMKKWIRGTRDSIKAWIKEGPEEGKKVRKLYRDGIYDGFHRRLGVRKDYRPGK